MDRLRSEQDLHDQQARLRAITFTQFPERLRVDDAAYLDHETWIRPAFAELGDVHGLQVLDLGCGHGMAAVVLARRGASMTAVDVSVAYLAEARQRALANGVQVHLVQANGERLPFPSATFDRIWGHAILHHLDLPVAAREIQRVLRPGGIAVFCEPWGENPLLNLLRRRLPSPGKLHTPHEEPLQRRQLRELQRAFPALRVQGFQLLAMLRNKLGPGRLTTLLERCDRFLLAHNPRLQRLCRYVMVVLRKTRSTQPR
jgi:ubiquinone/menaquinone biosynthesis C-methylase UbiE